jgi:hypothetical protein
MRMLAKILALMLHEVLSEYAQLCDDEEPEPETRVNIGFSSGRKKPDDSS